MKLRFIGQIVAVVAAASLLAACGGGSSGSDSLFSSGSSSSASGGSGSGSGSAGGTLAGCGYADLISSSERAQANECGIQVSAAYGQATSYLAAAIATCQKGDKTTADSIYNEQYKKTVTVARGTSEALSCGTANGGITVAQPSSSQSFHNFCNRTTVSGTKTNYEGSCYGPVVKDQFGCGSPGSGGAYTYVTQYSSESACLAARDTWLKSR
jgi:hypothetical protein